jgi:hypothetical protein
MATQLIPEFVSVDAEQQPKTSYEDDSLGRSLSTMFLTWANARKPQEEEWLRCLRAINKQNEEFVDEKGLHSHIYAGVTLTKCIAAFARISDPLFKAEKHWEVSPTPVPETEFNPEDYELFFDEVTRRAGLMETEIDDLLVDIEYEHHLKWAMMECVMLGSGCVKGATTSIQERESYQLVAGTWQKVTREVVVPLLTSPSVFSIFTDPDAFLSKDISGVFERHTVNRSQLAALKDDVRFDAEKIDRLLADSATGDHSDLYHEIERRTIANNNRNYAPQNMYDLLEYWGQVTGRELITAGFQHEDLQIKESDTYWCNIWVCKNETLFNRVMPLNKKHNPYNIFHYLKIPHRFWGFGVAFLNREMQDATNEGIRDLMDANSFASKPMAEVNVAMLKEGQDPNVMLPGMTYLRDSGDPKEPAVRFFSPQAPTAELRQAIELYRQMSDDGTMLPQFSYGDTSKEMNQTMGGLSMQLGVAALPTKVVIKNIEDDGIKPVIKSLYDFVMRWSDNEECKGDMNIVVKCSSVLLAKETRTQQLMQFSNVAASNPETAKLTDFKYLIREISKSLDIDPDKSVPEKPEQSPQEPQVSPKEQAEVELIQAKAAKEQASRDKVIAESANKNINTVFSAVQAAAQLAAQNGLVETADSLLKSAGFEDKDGTPIAQPSGVEPVNTAALPPQNTSPQFPPVPQQPMTVAPDAEKMAGMLKMQSPMRGIETMRNE